MEISYFLGIIYLSGDILTIIPYIIKFFITVMLLEIYANDLKYPIS